MKGWTLFFFFVIGYKGVGQIPVTDAAAGELLTQLNLQQMELNALQGKSTGLVGHIKASQELAEKGLEKYKWLEDLKTAKRLIDMLSNMICTTKELRVAMSLAESNCIFNFQYDMVLTKMQMSADILGLILTGIKMTSGERLKSLNDAVTRFDEAQRDMIKLTSQLNMRVDADNVEKQIEKLRKASDYIKIKPRRK